MEPRYTILILTGCVLSQSVMLFVCSLFLMRAFNLITRLSEALREATTMLNYARERECAQISGELRQVHIDELPTAQRDQLREQLTRMLAAIRKGDH